VKKQGPKIRLNDRGIFRMDNDDIANDDDECEDAHYLEQDHIFPQKFKVAENWMTRSIQISEMSEWLQLEND